MKKFIIGLVCLISPFLSYGHNPLASRYYLEAGPKVSQLTINLSQDGVNKAFTSLYGKEKIEAMSIQDYKELIVKYVKDNFSLTIDNKEIELGKGGIKYGSHQTDLKFVLPPIVQPIEQFEVSIPAFKENENHQTIFSNNFDGADHQILSALNDFKSTVILSEVKPKQNWLLSLAIGIVSILALLYFLFKRKKSLKLN